MNIAPEMEQSIAWGDKDKGSSMEERWAEDGDDFFTISENSDGPNS